MSPRTSGLMVNQDIPKDVICSNIFSRLPFKLVTCLKTISKDYYTHLTNETTFAAKQAALCPSCPALIHIGRFAPEYIYSLDVISSTPSMVGVPSSELDFLGCRMGYGRFDLLSSTNGLLCIRYTPYNGGSLTPPPTMHVANPATRQSQLIPGAPDHLDMTSSAIGLVFDPLDDPQGKVHKFMIVQALPVATINDTLLEFHFITFSSDTGRWVMSNTMITVDMEKVECQKVVYSSGVLYWDYQEDLLWFDVGRSAVGSIKMPWKLQGFNVEECQRHSIDVSSNGMLMCTTLNKDGLAIYQLLKIGDYHWELKHTNRWKTIVEMCCDEFQFCHSMKLRNGWQRKFYERWFVRPLGLESGRWVYIGVRQSWKDIVLRYDMDTGKVENTGKQLGSVFDMGCVFGYRNSMATLPPIFMPTLQDGICDGKSGGCMCAVDENEEE